MKTISNDEYTDDELESKNRKPVGQGFSLALKLSLR